MTTRIQITNFGPGAVKVKVLQNDKTGYELDQDEILYAQDSTKIYVHDDHNVFIEENK